MGLVLARVLQSCMEAWTHLRRAEVWPILVEGRYAPPAKRYLHLEQLQMPVLSLLTVLLPQLGHLWGLLMALTTLVQRFLSDAPPLVLSLRP